MPGMMVMSARRRLSCTVWLSSTSTPPETACLVSGSTSASMREAIELPSMVPSAQPMMLRATSSAVKSSPLFHFTPLRTLSV